MRDNGGEHRHSGIGEELGYMKGSPSLYVIPNLCRCVNHLTYIHITYIILQYHIDFVVDIKRIEVRNYVGVFYVPEELGLCRLLI
jgi:hypothetical protein